jgi:hypothetical protein
MHARRARGCEREGRQRRPRRWAGLWSERFNVRVASAVSWSATGDGVRSETTSRILRALASLYWCTCGTLAHHGPLQGDGRRCVLAIYRLHRRAWRRSLPGLYCRHSVSGLDPATSATGIGLTPATSATGIGLTPATSATGIELIPATSALGLGSPLPHLHRTAAIGTLPSGEGNLPRFKLELERL